MRKISEMLKQARLKKGLTLENIEKDTKIKKEFLEEIENGRFQNLPSESYALGFVKNYAKYLGISLTLAVPLYRREYKSKHSIHIVPNFRRTQHKFGRKFFLNTRSILIIIVGLIVGIYIFFQYSSFFFPPALAISTPRDGESVSGNIVQISGTTDSYATVSIDNNDVYVNIQGAFKKSEYMFPGDNKITIVAKNRFGKQTTRVITVKVK